MNKAIVNRAIVIIDTTNAPMYRYCRTCRGWFSGEVEIERPTGLMMWQTRSCLKATRKRCAATKRNFLGEAR